MIESDALLAVQDLDIQIMRINKQLEQMPQQEKLRAIELASKKLASQLKTIIGQRKDAQMDLEDNEQAHQEIIEKTAAVKAEAAERSAGFRQTRDLEAQLSSLAKRQEKLEFTYVELSEKLDKAQKAEANARALGQRLIEEKQAQEESFKQATSDLRAHLRVLNNQRESTLKDISPEVIASYNAAIKRFGGLAVESVELGEESVDVPSVCRVKLQSSLVAEVRRGSSIVECPYCHRMLVIHRTA